MTSITGWFLNRMSFADVPTTLSELETVAARTDVERNVLLGEPKWEPLFQGKRKNSIPGWVELQDLARFRRGIATGANNFFLLSLSRITELGLSLDRCLPCVGRAADVGGIIYTGADFEKSVRADGKRFLLNLTDPLNDA